MYNSRYFRFMKAFEQFETKTLNLLHKAGKSDYR